MPNPLVFQHYPDDFQVLTYTFNGSTPADQVLLYADRPLVIDSITVGVQAVGSTSAVLNFYTSADCTFGGTNVTIAAANIDTANVAAGDTIILDGVNNSSNAVRKYSKTGTAGSATGSTQLKYINASNTTIDNVLTTSMSTDKVYPVGTYLLLDVTGTIGSAKGLVQIRFRSRQA